MEHKTLREKNKDRWKRRISGKKTLLLLCLLPCLLFGCAKAPGINTESEESQGDKLLEAGSYQEAADLYQQKIDGGEGSEENYLLLFIALILLGYYNNAAAALETALS